MSCNLFIPGKTCTVYTFMKYCNYLKRKQYNLFIQKLILRYERLRLDRERLQCQC